MGKTLNNVVVSAVLTISPLSSANNLARDSRVSVDNTQVELSEILDSDKIRESVVVVNSDVVVDAVMNYFDENVKKFKLSSKARDEIRSILTSYFKFHFFCC